MTFSYYIKAGIGWVPSLKSAGYDIRALKKKIKKCQMVFKICFKVSDLTSRNSQKI